jgi:hypothetical protein
MGLFDKVTDIATGAFSGAVAGSGFGPIGIVGGGILGGIGGYSAARAREKGEALQGEGIQATLDALAQANAIMEQGYAQVGGILANAAGMAAAAGHEAAAYTWAKAKEAAAQILEGIPEAEAVMERYFAIADAKLEPFRAQGLIAMDELASMLGIPDRKGNLKPYDINKMRETYPGMDFVITEGTQAVYAQHAFSKLSGAAHKDIAEWTTGQVALPLWQHRVASLQDLVGVGATAGAEQAKNAISTGSAIADAIVKLNAASGNVLGTAAVAGGNQIMQAGVAGAEIAAQEANFVQQQARDMANLAITTGGVNKGVFDQRASNQFDKSARISEGMKSLFSIGGSVGNIVSRGGGGGGGVGSIFSTPVFNPGASGSAGGGTQGISWPGQKNRSLWS